MPLPKLLSRWSLNSAWVTPISVQNFIQSDEGFLLLDPAPMRPSAYKVTRLVNFWGSSVLPLLYSQDPCTDLYDHPGKWRRFAQGCAFWQGCGLGLERLGLEAISRRFLERLVSSRSWRLNVSVSGVWKNRTSRSHLGLEDITSRSRFRDFSLVNIHAMHQACGYITK